MISNKTRENRRGRGPKMSKNIERLYKEGKCSECSVVVTPMDFAKILGKFTKVKIQYESGSPKNKKGSQVTSPTNARLKNNENGMVLIHRNAYNQHPADLLKSPKTYGRAGPRNNNKNSTPQMNNLLTPTPRANNIQSPTPRANNILKENNRLKKTPVVKKPTNVLKNDVKSNLKSYGIVFTSPKSKKLESSVGNLTLKDILPIDKNILPSDDWCIDYLPKHGEPKEDKVYDRIAAELEDLMNNKTAGEKTETKTESGVIKDDFPSIMDILNDNTMTTSPANNQSSTTVQSNLESSDVEAMLLGKSSDSSQDAVTNPMEVDSSVISNLIDAVEMSIDKDDTTKPENTSDKFDNPNSPSILDETLEKGIEAHLPLDITSLPNLQPAENSKKDLELMETDTKNNTLEINKNDAKANEVKNSTVTHVVFKKCVNGECTKSVTCPKNLKYTVELEGKSVEFLGAPKYISCLDDLEVLLQIVNETELNSLYVWH
ncbi:hypothetical protein O0L34_g13979 [Tuta absoluta]|nr:hypothetical protein O0L34_g13979 [Tuta absoluta]